MTSRCSMLDPSKSEQPCSSATSAGFSDEAETPSGPSGPAASAAPPAAARNSGCALSSAAAADSTQAEYSGYRPPPSPPETRCETEASMMRSWRSSCRACEKAGPPRAAAAYTSTAQERSSVLLSNAGQSPASAGGRTTVAFSPGRVSPSAASASAAGPESKSHESIRPSTEAQLFTKLAIDDGSDMPKRAEPAGVPNGGGDSWLRMRSSARSARVLRPPEAAARGPARRRAKLEHRRLEDVDAHNGVAGVGRSNQLGDPPEQRAKPGPAPAVSATRRVAVEHARRVGGRRRVQQRQLGQQRCHMRGLAHHVAGDAGGPAGDELEQPELQHVARRRVESWPLPVRPLAQGHETTVELRLRGSGPARKARSRLSASARACAVVACTNAAQAASTSSTVAGAAIDGTDMSRREC
eukprot:scaffold11693_cov115-Isochrysis_galbana.AAC.17